VSEMHRRSIILRFDVQEALKLLNNRALLTRFRNSVASSTESASVLFYLMHFF
jgi:hypothetical protein